MRFAIRALLVIVALAPGAWGHDIPNARVDRSIQVTLRPGRLAIDYEVSLAELTLTRELRDLIGTLPGADRNDWFRRYGEVTGPLNAKGLLVAVDGQTVAPAFRGFDLVVEEHPRYTFHFAAAIPPQGRLRVQDTNYAASEGTSRLAVRGIDGVKCEGDDLPPLVDEIPVRAVWELSDADELRTRQVEVAYRMVRNPPVLSRPKVPPDRAASPPRRPEPLSGLLDRTAGLSWWALGLLAFALGAGHAIQPGHGKTLVAATALAEHGGWLSGTLVALIATVTHSGSVLFVAAGLWLTRSARYHAIHVSLAHVAGFLIAAIGLWKLGRHLGGFGEHDAKHDDTFQPAGVIGLGVAAGLVPCWDAVGLIVLAEAVGRLALGIALLLAFGLGMGAVLVAIGWVSARVRFRLERVGGEGRWERRFGLASGLALAGVGVYLLCN